MMHFKEINNATIDTVGFIPHSRDSVYTHALYFQSDKFEQTNGAPALIRYTNLH